MPLIPGVNAYNLARALAALPAAGAYDASPTEIDVQRAESVTLYIQYTRGAAGGDMQFKVEVSPFAQDTDAPAGVSAWYQTTLFAPGVVASSADSLSVIQRNETEYGSTAAGAESFAYGPIELDQTVQRLRVRAGRLLHDGGGLTCPR